MVWISSQTLASGHVQLNYMPFDAKMWSHRQSRVPSNCWLRGRKSTSQPFGGVFSMDRKMGAGQWTFKLLSKMKHVSCGQLCASFSSRTSVKVTKIGKGVIDCMNEGTQLSRLYSLKKKGVIHLLVCLATNGQPPTNPL